jgi:hypothetical protein
MAKMTRDCRQQSLVPVSDRARDRAILLLKIPNVLLRVLEGSDARPALISVMGPDAPQIALVEPHMAIGKLPQPTGLGRPLIL